MTTSHEHAARRGLLRRLPRVMAKVLLGIALALVLAELGLRFLLFTDLPAVAARTKSLREPSNFASRIYDENYWKLGCVFRARERQRETARDARLGWVRRDVMPRTYEHRDASEVGDRRPVLIFGDSFANCVTKKEDCWEGLMERSERGRQYKVVNYGTGGYGFDQIVLSVREVVPLYVDRKPVVIVSLLIDSDFERSTLRCRDGPKPHFSFDDLGRIALDGDVAATDAEFLSEHPIRIGSYLWRYLLHGSGLLSERWVLGMTGLESKISAARELNLGLIELVVSELEASGVEYFFLVFHSRSSFGRDARSGWEEPFLVENLERLHVPYVLSRTLLRRAAIEREVPEESFYIDKEPGRNHLTAEGNAIVFEAIERGLDERFDDLAALEWLGWDFIKRTGEGTSVRWLSSGAEGEPTALVLSIGKQGTVRMVYTLAARGTTLSARLITEGPPGSRAVLAVRLDDVPVHEETVVTDEAEVGIDIDLRGARSLSITARAEEPITLRCVDPRIERMPPGNDDRPPPAQRGPGQAAR